MLMISFYADDSKHIRIIFCTCLVIAPLFPTVYSRPRCTATSAGGLRRRRYK